MKPAVKVCGLTSSGDAGMAADAGADFLGFIFHPESPRGITREAFLDFRSDLPPAPRVYVQVNPKPDELRWADEAGFRFFQIHCTPEDAVRSLESWRSAVDGERIWLALKRRPGDPIPEHCLERIDTFLVDTFRPEGFGGSGIAGDWGAFRQLVETHPNKHWVLAGGLTSDNIREALKRSGARIIDVGSGVEKSPGQKDRERLKRFFSALA